jgi:hypothetical protein
MSHYGFAFSHRFLKIDPELHRDPHRPNLTKLDWYLKYHCHLRKQIGLFTQLLRLLDQLIQIAQLLLLSIPRQLNQPCKLPRKRIIPGHKLLHHELKKRRK